MTPTWTNCCRGNVIVFFLDYAWAGKIVNEAEMMSKADTELNFHIITECSRNKNLQSSINLWGREKNNKTWWWEHNVTSSVFSLYSHFYINCVLLEDWSLIQVQ